MTQHLLKRGYTKGCINDAINKASKVPREASLKENHDRQTLDRVPLVITYNLPPPPLLLNLPKLPKDSQIILDASEKCKTVFQTLPLVSCRRGRNLNNMLFSKRIPSQKNTNQEKKDPQDHYNTPTQPKSNQCPECGIILKNEKGLKIHGSSKHQKKNNTTTSPGFWPCNSDTRCNKCKRDFFVVLSLVLRMVPFIK